MAFEINKRYNFDTLAPSILGVTFTNVKVTGIMDAQGALRKRDIATLHTNLRGVIPGLPEDLGDLVFVEFENTDGIKTILAQEYINTTSVVVVTSINLRLDMLNVTQEDLSIIRDRLVELGYSDFNLSTYNV